MQVIVNKKGYANFKSSITQKIFNNGVCNFDEDMTVAMLYNKSVINIKRTLKVHRLIQSKTGTLHLTSD